MGPIHHKRVQASDPTRSGVWSHSVRSVRSHAVGEEFGAASGPLAHRESRSYAVASKAPLRLVLGGAGTVVPAFAAVATVPAPSDPLLLVWRDERIGAAVLSAVAGFVDTAGFIALFGLFPAHLTGNFVTAGAAMSSQAHVGVGIRLMMIPLFMASVVMAALFARRARARSEAPLAAHLWMLTVALGAFCLTGVFFRQGAGVHQETWGLAFVASMSVIAMGIQNAMMRDVLGSCCPTTVMTGNLTQFTIDLVELMAPSGVDASARTIKRRQARRRLVRFGSPVMAFLGGATLGAWLTGAAGLLSILVPTVAIAVCAHRASRTV